MTNKCLAPVEQWMTDEELQALYSSAYWNDIEEEKKKDWWIADGDYDKCLRYLHNSGLLGEYQMVEKWVEDIGGENLQIADLAAGIGWTSALLSKHSKVDTVHAVEISKHRLITLFAHGVRMVDGDPKKIRRYVGSFYDLQFADHSMDLIFLSQAFHHANRPLRLLNEMDRVLKGGGRIILIGEHFTRPISKLRRMVKIFIKEKKLCTNFFELFPPDKSSGDHYYRVSDYHLFFQLLGYKVKHHIVGSRSIIVAADKPLPQTFASCKQLFLEDTK